MSRLLDIEGTSFSDLKLSTSFEDRFFTVTSDGNALFSISHSISTDDPKDASRYLACFCQTGHSAAADFRPVTIKETERTAGYVFPVTTFREADLLDGWPARFAEVGFRRLLSLETLNRFSRYRTVDELTERQELPLDEAFSDDLSVLVLGIEQIKELKVSLPELQLALHRAGIWIADNFPPPRTVENNGRGAASNYVLRRVSYLMRADIEYFLQLLRDADRDSSEVGRFITYYQVVEYCIEQIFGWSVSQVASQKMTTWELRERLSSAANEKRRIGLLASECLDATWERNAAAQVSDVCRRILGAVGETFENGDQWGTLLYKVRSLIVHNQLRLLRSGQNHLLAELNSAFRVICYNLVYCFKKPDALLA